MKKDKAEKNQPPIETDGENQNTEVLEENEKDDSFSEETYSEEEIRNLKEDYLRVLAESENVKKRCAAEIEKNNKYAIASFAKDLLGVADNLDRALNAGENETSGDCSSFLKGVELTRNELLHVFAKFGVEPVESVGKVFDPNFHRVIQEVCDNSKPAGTIIAELQKGYLLNGRILREAMVVVSKNS